MAKPKIPSQKNRYAALKGRLNQYSLLVQNVLNTLNSEVAQMVTRTGYDGTKAFSFSDYPQTKAMVEALQARYVSEMRSLIYSTTSEEWKKSNLAQDLIATKALKFYGATVGGEKTRKYYQTNSDALKAFQERRDKGLGLSERLWNQSVDYKEEMEYAISSAVQKGTSAVTLSKRLSKYLQNFDQLKKDYKERYGRAVDCSDCEYNSIRLARTEISMAYRTAEQKRWEQFDFVIGYEIKLSGSHKVTDICDKAKGKYPKKFKFKGWHPNCFCYCIPILMTEDEFWELENNPREVKEFPAGFGEWIAENCERIEAAYNRNTLPYWLKDNDQVRDCAVLMGKAQRVGDAIQAEAERIASECGGVVTPINYKGFGSMYRKLTDPSEPITIADIKDSVRNTIVVDRKHIEQALEELQSLDSFARLKRQTPDKFCGYSGNIVNLNMPNGIKAEIQVNTPMMIYAKETEQNARRILGDDVWELIANQTGLPGGLGHHLYEEIRVLDKVKDSEKIASLTRKSEEYYSHFRGDVHKFAMTEDLVESLFDSGFKHFSASEYRSSAMARFNIERFDAAMLHLGDERNVYWKTRRIDFLQNGNAQLKYEGVNEAGEFIELKRDFRKGKDGIEVHHSMFTIPESMQGSGFSKEVLRSLFTLYKEAKIKKVDLFANLEVGGYCWGRYGFYAERWDAERCIRRALKNGAITSTQADLALEEISEFGDVIPMNRLADLSFGKDMLLGSDWDGWITFDSEKQVNHLFKYLGLK